MPFSRPGGAPAACRHQEGAHHPQAQGRTPVLRHHQDGAHGHQAAGQPAQQGRQGQGHSTALQQHLHAGHQARPDRQHRPGLQLMKRCTAQQRGPQATQGQHPPGGGAQPPADTAERSGAFPHGEGQEQQRLQQHHPGQQRPIGDQRGQAQQDREHQGLAHQAIAQGQPARPRAPGPLAQQQRRRRRGRQGSRADGRRGGVEQQGESEAAPLAQQQGRRHGLQPGWRSPRAMQPQQPRAEHQHRRQHRSADQGGGDRHGVAIAQDPDQLEGAEHPADHQPVPRPAVPQGQLRAQQGNGGGDGQGGAALGTDGQGHQAHRHVQRGDRGGAGDGSQGQVGGHADGQQGQGRRRFLDPLEAELGQAAAGGAAEQDQGAATAAHRVGEVAPARAPAPQQRRQGQGPARQQGEQEPLAGSQLQAGVDRQEGDPGHHHQHTEQTAPVLHQQPLDPLPGADAGRAAGPGDRQGSRWASHGSGRRRRHRLGLGRRWVELLSGGEPGRFGRGGPVQPLLEHPAPEREGEEALAQGSGLPLEAPDPPLKGADLQDPARRQQGQEDQQQGLVQGASQGAAGP